MEAPVRQRINHLKKKIEMAGQPTSQSPSDNSWPKMPLSAQAQMAPRSPKPANLEEFLSPVDEVPDFHDPYSELSLFLSQKIQDEFKQAGFVKKWSVYLQEKLIQKIGPEFQKKFPTYRLGVSALRKIWEKIAYYSEQIQTKKEALTETGKLNISYLIQENLRQYFQFKTAADVSPYHFAHQLAAKISDCLATIEGVRPALDHLSRTIWSVERHMLTAEALARLKSPYDELDKWDKLIIKTQLEISGKHPQLSQKELEAAVKESIRSLQELPSFASLDRVGATVSALLAERLYPNCDFHILHLSEQKEAAFSFIRRHISLYQKTSAASSLSDLVRRVMAIYSLAAQMPREDLPETPQPVKAFLAAQHHLTQGNDEEIEMARAEAKLLPFLPPDTLELVTWKIVNETVKLLDELPYRAGSRFEEEIAHILIDNPHLPFQSIVNTVVQFFRKAKELAGNKNWAEIEKKISIWANQGDLICRWLRLENNTPILQLISAEGKKGFQSHMALFAEVTQIYLRQYPTLAPFAPQVSARVGIYCKYAWYALFATPEETSIDRFLAWHIGALSHLEEELVLKHLEEQFRKTLPLIPFDRFRASSLLACEKKKAQTNQRQAK